jgi:hypothetical protein
MTVVATSTSCALRSLVEGPRQKGTALGHGHVDVGGYVVSLTAPGGPRMPNGIEVGVALRPGEAVCLGEGRIEIAECSVVVLPGAWWDPVPHAVADAADAVDGTGLLRDVGRGPGLTPRGDDVLAGYCAGLALLHGRHAEGHRLASAAAPRTTALSATLLLHAARGEVPEPVHRLLEHGDANPLLRFGTTSGVGWLEGLCLAGLRRQASAMDAAVAADHWVA